MSNPVIRQVTNLRPTSRIIPVRELLIPRDVSTSLFAHPSLLRLSPFRRQDSDHPSTAGSPHALMTRPRATTRLLAALNAYPHEGRNFYFGPARLRVTHYHHRRLAVPSACLWELYVPPQHRRQGYGAYAMQTVLHLADRYRVTLVLNARSFGSRVARRTLIAWYISLGFRPIDLGYVHDYVRFPK